MFLHAPALSHQTEEKCLETHVKNLGKDIKMKQKGSFMSLL